MESLKRKRSVDEDDTPVSSSITDDSTRAPPNSSNTQNQNTGETFQKVLFDYLQTIIVNQEKLEKSYKDLKADMHRLNNSVALLRKQPNPNIHHTSSNQGRPADNNTDIPRAQGDKSAALSDLFEQHIPAQDNPRAAQTLLTDFKNICYRVVETFIQRNEGQKYQLWDELSTFDKSYMLSQATNFAARKDPRLAFLYRCEGKWPCEFVVKPKWTNITRRNRKSRMKVEKLIQLQQSGQGEPQTLPSSSSGTSHLTPAAVPPSQASASIKQEESDICYDDLKDYVDNGCSSSEKPRSQ